MFIRNFIFKFSTGLFLIIFSKLFTVMSEMCVSSYKSTHFKLDISNNTLVLMKISYVKSKILCFKVCSEHDSCLALGYRKMVTSDGGVVTANRQCHLLTTQVTEYFEASGNVAAQFWNKQVFSILRIVFMIIS